MINQNVRCVQSFRIRIGENGLKFKGGERYYAACNFAPNIELTSLLGVISMDEKQKKKLE